MHLTKRQKEIFDYICSYLGREGYAPSLEEIGEEFGLSSVATVHTKWIPQPCDASLSPEGAASALKADSK